MYLTVFKQNNLNTQHFDYNNIMDNQTEYIPITYYKTTWLINNPKPRTELNHNQRTHISQAENTITIQATNLLRIYGEATDLSNYYRTFKIPKHSGGLRTINAPKYPFMDDLASIKDTFDKVVKCLPHDCAYAYTKNRSIKDELKRHQANQSNWYLKIDLKDFFPSCSPEFIYNQLIQLYPFYYFSGTGKQSLKYIIQLCCLNNELPQGTPMSPLLTNLVMVPYDYQINQILKRGTGEHYVYTRYADDILISSKSKFDYQKIIHLLKQILQPFQIKEEKTRFGSKNGRNWNLGLMLNKDNEITLGYRKKKLLNAMLNNFLNDYTDGNRWSKEDTYSLQGQIGYLKHIEPEYAEYIIEKYSRKYDIDYSLAISNILNNRE
jgi:hypothetical protein